MSNLFDKVLVIISAIATVEQFMCPVRVSWQGVKDHTAVTPRIADVCGKMVSEWKNWQIIASTWTNVFPSDDVFESGQIKNLIGDLPSLVQTISYNHDRLVTEIGMMMDESLKKLVDTMTSLYPVEWHDHENDILDQPETSAMLVANKDYGKIAEATNAVQDFMERIKVAQPDGQHALVPKEDTSKASRARKARCVERQQSKQSKTYTRIRS